MTRRRAGVARPEKKADPSGGEVGRGAERSRREVLGGTAALAASAAALAVFGAPARRPGLEPAAAGAVAAPAVRPRGPVVASGQAGPLAVGTTAEVPTLDPLELGDGMVVRAVFDRLGRLSAGEPAVAPLLARSIHALSSSEVLVELDPAARFSNGSPVSAADVAFSLHTILESGFPLAAELGSLAEATPLGARTLRVRSSRPDALLARRLAIVPVVPKSAYTAASPAFARHPVGSGRFTVSGFSPGSSVELAASPASWQGPPASPAASVRQLVTEDALLQAARSGELDLAEDVPPAGVAGLAGAMSIAAVDIGIDSFVVMRTASGPFADRRVRLAANLAVDAPALVAGVLGGAGGVLSGQLTGPACIGYQPGLEPLGFDPGRARRLLAEAGHGGGIATELAGPSALGATLAALATSLARVGIRARIVELSTADWLQALAGGESPWPMLLTVFDEAPLYDAGSAYELVQRLAGGGGLRGAGAAGSPASPAAAESGYRRLLAAAAGELDTGRRARTLAALAALVHDQLPCIFLYRQRWLYAWLPGVLGMPPRRWPLELASITAPPPASP